jgi:hypothetical protein
MWRALEMFDDFPLQVFEALHPGNRHRRDPPGPKSKGVTRPLADVIYSLR